jgi:hypothetical protein
MDQQTASSRANQQRCDKQPTYELLQQRRDRIIHCWRGLNGAFDVRFRNEAQSLVGRQPLDRSRWEIQLFNRFVEAIETTAIQRGAERWEPRIQIAVANTPSR